MDRTLPQLADPGRYAACQWDLKAMHDQRDYWLALFRGHFPGLLDEALKVELAGGKGLDEAQRRIEGAREVFFAFLDAAGSPADFDRLTVLSICEERERVLRDAGLDDPYRLAKGRENDAAMELLPRLLAELDAMSDADRAAALVRGVFAGNIFDLGATETAEAFKHQRVNFHATRSGLKDRPWLIDDLDAWLDRWRRKPWRAALLFVDNAGPDVVLGMLPLARELVRRGTRVLLAANSTPSLNDVTHAELAELLGRASGVDEMIRAAIGDGSLAALADGNGYPLIDLTRLDPRFAAAAAREPIDLVVLEGMGRAVESNFDARFVCDVLKIAMVKDRGVADALGGELYDLVCRFEVGAAGPTPTGG